MQRDLSHFKKDIVEACSSIGEFVEGMDFPSFVKDDKTYTAVLMKIAIIGECASHFGEEIRIKNPNIDWQGMKDMRNFLIHEYFEVDPKVVWKTIQEDVPKLLKDIENLIL
jgi:uncharacterized protein with HEPN domain